MRVVFQMKRRKSRVLWGVLFRGANPPEVGPLFRGWHIAPETPYPGEPTRPLLFCSRASARVWCGAKNAEWRARAETNALVRRWRVRPVRVRETLQVIGR